jgi:exosortase E/protease (VPEID-CTERM system)
VIPATLAPAVGAPGTRAPARWAALVALLVVELLALTTRFDTDRLTGNGAWWAVVLGEAHYLPQFALTVAAALLMFGGERLRAAVTAAAAARGPHPWAGALAAHVGGFVGVAGLALLLLEGGGGGVAFAGLLVAGLAMVAGWCLLLLPPAAWLALARGAGWPLAACALLTGVVGFGAGRVAEPLWGSMADGTLAAARTVLGLVFADVTTDPADRLLGAGGFVVRIAPSCSGYEGLGLVLAFAGLFVALRRDELRFPNALLLLPLGLAAAWAANVLRIAVLIAVGAWGWPEVARGGFHSQAGWLSFIVVALGVVAAGRRSRFFARVAAAPATNPAAPFVVPLLAVVGTAMLTGAFSAGGFDVLYGARVVAAGAAVWGFRRCYAGLGWSASGAAVGIGVVVFAFWLGLDALAGGPAGESPIPAGLASLPAPWAAAWLAARVAGAVLVVPLAEELAFRGYLLRRLRSAEFDAVPPTAWSWPAVLASSLVFGLLHPDRWVAGTLAGVCYSAAYARRGRLADAVVAHAVTNALLAAYVLATGTWALW